MLNKKTLLMPEFKTAEERALWFIESAIVELMGITDETDKGEYNSKNNDFCGALVDLRAVCDVLEYWKEV